MSEHASEAVIRRAYEIRHAPVERLERAEAQTNPPTSGAS
jgi:hypothetical protein